MEQMFHFQKTDDEEMTGNSQHTFIKSKPYLTRLIAFYDEMIGSVDKGEGIDERMQSNLSCLQQIFQHDFPKDPQRLKRYGLDLRTIHKGDGKLYSKSSDQQIESSVNWLVFYVFIYYLKDGMECTHRKFTADNPWEEQQMCCHSERLNRLAETS